MDNNYKHIVLHFDTAERPKFTERKGKGWIEFGADNNYPQYLLDLFNESPKHGAIVKSKVTYIYGQGFDTNGTANSIGETWNEILKKAIKDDELYRGYYLQVIWNRAGKISDVFHIDFQKVRTNKERTMFYVKNDWCDMREKAREYPAFNLSNPVGSQIYYYKEYNSFSEVYPIPAYYQGLNYIESDIQVSRHILGNAKHGFVGSTLINLNNGDPIGEEHKGEVERQLLKKFTGDNGKRVVIMFNKSKENSADIQNLGNTMLTKEDFTNINNLIQQEIFASHQITSAELFGISVPGALGSRTAMRDAFEIFNKTYVNDRQQDLEQVFTKLRNYKGEQGDFKIVPIEPLKFEFSEAIMAANLTQNEIRELMGKEPIQTGNVLPSGNTAIAQSQMESNDAIRNLTGRQYQNVMRIVRHFGSGKLTKQQASLMLKSGFGFTDADINTFLGVDNDPLTDDEIQKFNDQEDDRIFNEFASCGDNWNDFELLNRYEAFIEPVVIYQLEANVIEMINNDKRVTPEGMAKALDVSVDDVLKTLDSLEKKKVIATKEKKVGNDLIYEREVLKPLSKLDGKEPNVTELFIRYTYEWRVPAKQQNIKTSRAFCKKMMSLSAGKSPDNTGDRTWSMSDIQKMSVRLGYSVLDRCGGFWNNNGTIEYQCRHQWVANVMTKKKK